MILGFQQNSLTQPQDPGTVALTGEPAAILLLAAILAWPISIGLLRLYRRAVLTSMDASANQRGVEPVAPETSTSSNRSAQITSGPPIDRVSSVTAGAAENLNSTLLRTPWRPAALYAVAGFCYALVMAAASLASWKTGFLLIRFLVLLWIYAWPVVLAVNLVAASTRRAKLLTAVCYFFVLAILGATAALRSSMFVFG
jgi:hypothetical protein